MSLFQGALAVLSGSLVGFTLGLIGGGGSILATPLLVYVVGIANPHVAIGTSAVAVAANAALNLWNHARRGTVKWRCALVFAASGVAGALIGAAAGKAVDGEKLLALFSILMVAVGVLMLRNRKGEGLTTQLPPIGRLLADYYEVRGWSEEGLPTPDTLRQLGL